MQSPILRSHLLGAIIGIVCGLGILGLQRNHYRSLQAVASREGAARQEQEARVSLEVQKQLPTLGFDNLLADWAYLRFVQYHGDTEIREAIGYQLLPDYFELVVDRDPRFVPALMQLSTATTLFAGRPDKTVENLNQATPFLQPSIDRAYAVWSYKAIDEMLFLGEIDAARHSYQMAAEWASLSDDPFSDAVARRSRETAQFLATRPNSCRARVTGLVLIISNATDEETRRRVAEEIERLGGEFTPNEGGGFRIKPPPEDSDCPLDRGIPTEN